MRKHRSQSVERLSNETHERRSVKDNGNPCLDLRVTITSYDALQCDNFIVFVTFSAKKTLMRKIRAISPRDIAASQDGKLDAD